MTSHSTHPSPVHRSSTTSQEKDKSHGSNHDDYIVSETEERLTEALREAADARMLLVSRLEENAKQSGRQTEMVAQLISMHQTVSSMREHEAELLEEIDILKDELAKVRSEQQQAIAVAVSSAASRGNSPQAATSSHNNNNTRDLTLISGNNDPSVIVMSDEVRFELNRLRNENSALRTQCEFLSEEVKTTISLAAASQRRSAELSRMISADERK